MIFPIFYPKSWEMKFLLQSFPEKISYQQGYNNKKDGEL